MPKTEVVIFAEADGSAPLLGWLDKLPAKARIKCVERVQRLGQLGHEMRRPLADYLRGGVYELRVRHMRVNYRILYFFDRRRAVLSHGLTKEQRVPDREIERAARRMGQFRADPEKHTYREGRRDV